MKTVAHLALFVLLVVGAKPSGAVTTNEIESVTLRTQSGYTMANEWELFVPKSGDAHLRWGKLLDAPVTNLAPAIPRAQATVRVSEDRRALLFAEISKLELARLYSHYGDQVIDASTRTLSIVTSKTNLTVAILGLHNWQLKTDRNHRRLAEVVPLLKIWDLAYRCFVDPHLIDFSQADNEIIEQVQKDGSNKVTGGASPGQR